MVATSSALAAPAAAQDKPVAAKSTAEAAQSLQKVGHCIARGRPERAHEFVTMDYRSDAYRTIGRKLGRYSRSCAGFSHGLSSSSLIFAGAIAEGLLIDQGLVDRLADATAHDPARQPIEAGSGEDVFAYCVVRKDADAVAALLKTPYVSDEEMTALKALVPTLPQCVPEGQQPRFNREALRSLFALAAYRLYAHNSSTND